MAIAEVQIRDWSWTGTDGLRYGHVTARAAVAALAPAAAAGIAASLAAKPVPADRQD